LKYFFFSEEAKMPERRKMKSPSPKMTSTPKMKRKEVDTESTEELQKRLGYSDNPTQKKGMIQRNILVIWTVLYPWPGPSRILVFKEIYWLFKFSLISMARALMNFGAESIVSLK
jgi:hypothetical protein